MASGSLLIGGVPVQAMSTPHFQQCPSVQPGVLQFQPMTMQGQPMTMQGQPIVMQVQPKFMQVQQPQPVALQGVVQQASVQQVPVIPATVSGGVIQPVAVNSTNLQPQVTVQTIPMQQQPLVINTAALQPQQVYSQQFMDPYAYQGYQDPYQDPYQDGYYQDYPQYDDGYGYDDYGYQDNYDDYGDEGYDYMPQPPQPQPIVITNNNDNSSRGSSAGGNREPIIIKMNNNKKKPRPRPRPQPQPQANDCQPSYTIIKKVVREKVGKSRRSKHDSDSDEENGGLSSADLKILRKLKI